MQKLIFRNGAGTEIDLTSGNFGITEWEGFSADSLNIQSQQVPFQDGAVFLDALMEQRELSVTVAMQDNNNLEKRYELRRQMISTMNPKLGEGVLIYTNDFLSKQIHVIPQLPVFQNKNSNDSGTPKAECSFTACNPYWEDLEEKVEIINLGEIKEVTNEGDVPVQLKIDFLTRNVINPKITRMSDNAKIEYNGNLTRNLFINTNVGEKEVRTETMKQYISNISSTINGVCYSNKLSMYVGVSAGIVYYSYDLEKWEISLIGTDTTFYSVTYSEELNLFVAVGNSGRIRTSPDGINWTSRTSGVSVVLRSVTYSEELNLFVTVGNSGRILTSPDGISWTSRTSGVSTQLNGITYSDELNIFIVVGASGLILTSTDGINWTSRTSGVTTSLNKVTYSDELNIFVIVGTSGRILTSPDGINWTSRTSGVSSTLNDVTYFKTLKIFIVVGASGRILTSPDGINWTSRTSGVTTALLSVVSASDLNQVVIMGENGTIIISTNGINWVNKTNIISGYAITNVIYSEEKKLYIITGGSETAHIGVIITSEDLSNFEIRYYNNFTGPINGITYSKELDMFVAVGLQSIVNNYAQILTSSDGINWTLISGYEGYLYKVIYIKEKHLFVTIGANGLILTSSNGIDWTSRTSGTEEELHGIAFSEDLDLICIVGNNGINITSQNGINWTLQNTIQANLNDLIYVKEEGIFVAVGSSIVISPDGINWEKLVDGLSLFCVCYSKELHLFMALGLSGNHRTSYDGRSWQNFTIPIYIRFNGVNYSEKKEYYLLAGNNATITYLSYLPIENQIQNLSSDSDIGFNLQIGLNKIRITRDSGDFTARIKYRQKYIGV